ncbi:MAG: LamG domain-containing protein, partial [Candidatus Pacebacteria bacterium]|nr:LamG domain-containing protein [Candidatus Paceibacterota bacterium]
LDFDGTDDNVDAGNDASLDITDEITVSAWFYQETQNEHKGIVSKWGAADVTRSWYLLTILDAGESYIRMIVKDTVDVQYTVQNPLPISINTWYHVVGVYNGSDIVLYVNGTEVDSVSAGASLDSVSSSVVIGALGNLPASNTAFEFDGLIDEVKIYNYALTAEQIKTEYNGGAVNFR